MGKKEGWRREGERGGGGGDEGSGRGGLESGRHRSWTWRSCKCRAFCPSSGQKKHLGILDLRRRTTAGRAFFPFFFGKNYTHTRTRKPHTNTHTQTWKKKWNWRSFWKTIEILKSIKSRFSAEKLLKIKKKPGDPERCSETVSVPWSRCWKISAAPRPEQLAASERERERERESARAKERARGSCVITFWSFLDFICV